MDKLTQPDPLGRVEAGSGAVGSGETPDALLAARDAVAALDAQVRRVGLTPGRGDSDAVLRLERQSVRLGGRLRRLEERILDDERRHEQQAGAVALREKLRRLEQLIEEERASALAEPCPSGLHARLRAALREQAVLLRAAGAPGDVVRWSVLRCASLIRARRAELTAIAALLSDAAQQLEGDDWERREARICAAGMAPRSVEERDRAGRRLRRLAAGWPELQPLVESPLWGHALAHGSEVPHDAGRRARLARAWRALAGRISGFDLAATVDDPGSAPAAAPEGGASDAAHGPQPAADRDSTSGASNAETGSGGDT